VAATVKSYIEGRGIPFDTVKHAPTGSSEENARESRVDKGHIAKAVMLQDEFGAVMVVVPGDSWVRLAAVNRELDRSLTLATEADSAARFPDCKAGAIPPLGPAYGVETLLDLSLSSLAFVYFESGDHLNLLRVSGQDFLDLLGGVRRGHFCDAE